MLTGEMIKAGREHLGWSLERLAANADMQPDEVASVEAGAQHPKQGLLRQILADRKVEFNGEGIVGPFSDKTFEKLSLSPEAIAFLKHPEVFSNRGLPESRIDLPTKEIEAMRGENLIEKGQVALLIGFPDGAFSCATADFHIRLARRGFKYLAYLESSKS